MNRERALKVVLVLVGLLFLAGVYPLTMFLWHPNQSEAALTMMLGVYFTLGIFVLLAARNPSANRSLIAFTAWSSLVSRRYHGGAVIPDGERTRTSAGRRGFVRYHRCSPDRAGFGKPGRRAGIRSQCVGSHSGERANDREKP